MATYMQVDIAYLPYRHHQKCMRPHELHDQCYTCDFDDYEFPDEITEEEIIQNGPLTDEIADLLNIKEGDNAREVVLPFWGAGKYHHVLCAGHHPADKRCRALLRTKCNIQCGDTFGHIGHCTTRRHQLRENNMYQWYTETHIECPQETRLYKLIQSDNIFKDLPLVH